MLCFIYFPLKILHLLLQFIYLLLGLYLLESLGIELISQFDNLSIESRFLFFKYFFDSQELLLIDLSWVDLRMFLHLSYISPHFFVSHHQLLMLLFFFRQAFFH